MRFPGAPSLVFLAYILVFLPWAALRSRRRFRSATDGTAARALPPRKAIWVSTLISLALLFLLAWLTGRSFRYEIFAVKALEWQEVIWAVVALTVCFGLRAILRRLRTEEERRKMMVYRIAPRTGGELLLWSATVLAASVAEEAAYRGVGMSILWYALGSPWLAALVCAAAFSLGHSIQGWKSAAVIFAMALAFHGLVALTGTLVLAMVVHAIYDFVAGDRIRRDAARYDREAAAAVSNGPGLASVEMLGADPEKRLS